MRSLTLAALLISPPLLVGAFMGCQVLVSAELDVVRCEQEGTVGAPACPEGESCQGGVCVGCSATDLCGDGIDNDCDGEMDEGCEDAGDGPEASDANDAADVSVDVFEEPVPDLSARVTGGLLVVYAFMEGRGDVVKDYAALDPPLNLRIGSFDHVTWLDGGGLRIEGPTTIASETLATRIVEACQNSKAITVEAWVQPALAQQEGPARIISMSFNPYLRNFTLGQAADAFDFRLRTIMTDDNGLPSLASDAGVATTELTHVVYVRNSGGLARLVINGQEAASTTVAGELSNWDPDYRLIVGNEFQVDRVWLGTIYLLAVYARPLTPADISTNYDAGPPRAR
jgi:hypothetical protein